MKTLLQTLAVAVLVAIMGSCIMILTFPKAHAVTYGWYVEYHGYAAYGWGWSPSYEKAKSIAYRNCASRTYSCQLQYSNWVPRP